MKCTVRPKTASRCAPSRYHERPLHLHPHGVRVQGGEDEGDHYEDDYADDVYVDADVPYGKRAGQKEQQQRQPYVPNYNTNYLHHNDFRQETLPTYRPYYYGQSYRNTYVRDQILFFHPKLCTYCTTYEALFHRAGITLSSSQLPDPFSLSSRLPQPQPLLQDTASPFQRGV